MKLRRLYLVFISYFLLVPTAGAQSLSLAGAWDFRMGDVDGKPNSIPDTYDDYVMLPGSMLTNGKGHPVSVKTPWTGSLYDSSYYFNPYMEKYRHEGAMKFPFFLTPEYHYVGAAWYHKSVYVPLDWSYDRVILFLERPHIETTVYVNGKEVGHQLSLSTPHRYDVTKYVKPGEKNDISIRVYNGIENVCVGQDSHSVTDQTQGNWNGITGRMELQLQPKVVSIRNVRVYPDIASNTVTIIASVESSNDIEHFLVGAAVEAIVGNTTKKVTTVTGISDDDDFMLTINLGDSVRLWDEFSPSLYRLTLAAHDDVYETLFGMRDIRVKGRQMYINGRPLFLRGTVDNCCFPETGYPPTDEEEWLRIFRKCKEYGINHVRFHSYCPPEAAFCAADRVGIYLQPEGPSWPNHGVKLRRGQKIDKYLLEESKRIIDTYGNHPSFVMMAAGNEPAGDWVRYCNDWVKEMKKYDPSKIYAGASVGGGWAWDDGSEYHVKGGARGLDWDRHAPSSSDDYYSGIEFPRNYKPLTGDDDKPVANQSPIVAHEQGQWCAFPDFREIKQYTGAYKALNFEIFRDLLRDNGMESMANKFLMASGRLQTLCYKYEIERNLRTKDYAGFQLLGLNDYSGQGTALVGPLNVHWREKGYVDATQWRQFCSPLTLLARFPKFVFTSDEQVTIPVELMNATPYSFKAIPLHYQILCGDSIVVTDSLEAQPAAIGKGNSMGSIALPLATLPAPAKLTLTAYCANGITNSWDFWVYPEEMRNEKLGMGNVYETDTLDAKAVKVLQKGGTVLLTAGGKIRYGNDVRHNFLPVFWNTSWFKMRPPHTTGAYIQKEHPVFRDFPTDDWQNLNWWELTNRTQVMNLAEFPADYQPIVQPIDTWHVSRKLGMLVEARVLKGRLLMTTMDISRNLEHRPVARQLRHSILRYMQSADFQPSVTVGIDTIRHLFEKEAPKVNMFTNESPDELKPKIGG